MKIINGIKLIKSKAMKNKKDLLINEGLTVANNAREYYHKPRIFGGGQNSFANWEIPPTMKTSGNGEFTADVNVDFVEITGTGNELMIDGELMVVKFVVNAFGIETVITE